ncbi:hypothetical protein [Thermovibrio sp.]
MKVEGIKSQGKPIGKGDIKFSFKEGKIVFQVSGKPREKEEDKFQPMEGEILEFPLERNRKAVFSLAVEGRNSLIAKALKEKEEQEFDLKLQGGEGIYAGIRGHKWGFTMLIRKGEKEAFLILKPKEFYPLVRTFEKLAASEKKASKVISTDLDVLICEAEKGKGLSFRSVEEWKEIERLEDKALLVALSEDLTDRTRVENMYSAKFGPISLIERNGRTYLKVGGRNYLVNRKNLLTFKLLADAAL